MLLCECCKKSPATVHLTEIPNDEKKEIHETYGRKWLKVSRYGPGELEAVVTRIESEHRLPVFVPTAADGTRALVDRVVEYFARFGP